MNRFLNLLQFLTRITVKRDLKFVDDMGETIVFFPLVGVVISVLMFVVYYLICNVFDVSSFLAISVVIVMVEAVITGGLHIDGFGDTFDGIFSYRPKERILEIMKDPRMGTNGILAIVFLILSKVVFSSVLFENGLWILVFQAPIIGRLMPVILSFRSVSARKNGMGEFFIGKCRVFDLVVSFVYSTLIILGSTFFFLNGYFAIINIGLIVLMVVFVLLLKRGVYKKIDGLTGDILGCSVELIEMLYLIFAVLIMK